MNTIIAWGIVVCGLTILVGAYALKVRTNRLRKLERCANLFYENLDILVADDDAPEAALDLFEFVNRHIRKPGVPYVILMALLFHQDQPISPAMSEVREYYTKRPELAGRFLTALVAAIFAITYSSALAGWIIRRLVIFDLDRHKDRAPDIISMTYKGGDGLAHAH